MKFKNAVVGYEYEATVKGQCASRNGASTVASYSWQNYELSMDAKKYYKLRLLQGSETNVGQY